MTSYQDFIEAKRHTSINYGIDVNWLPDQMFDFQKHIAEYSIKKGRSAVFLDTGLGKSLIELTIAKNFVKATKKPVLIVTPLAVAGQFVREATKFGIGSVTHSKDGRIESEIVVCNYERIKYFDSKDFDCIILDESSILKNFDGAIKTEITAFMRKVKYRFLFTATPSPNDYIELGTSSEALGYMGFVDMLSRFFTNNMQSVDIRHAGAEWRLKNHAERDFWAWVASWSVSAKKPSDLGFSDERYDLPALHENIHTIKNQHNSVVNGQIQMFALPAVSFAEIKEEVKATVVQRCEAAAKKASQHEISVLWANRNDEADYLLKFTPGAKEVRGTMDIDEKEEILEAFANGQIKKLVTKPTITAFGLNWQHCNHTTYFPTYSYEQYYQSLRRFWRFGQTRDVFCDLIVSEGQSRIMDTLLAKKDKAQKMFDNLVKMSNDQFKPKQKKESINISLPNFLKND